MNLEEIKEKIDDMWEESQERNIGSNESELDFKDSIADWIYKIINLSN